MARPERFELPTNWFEASYSIQLSYGRFCVEDADSSKVLGKNLKINRFFSHLRLFISHI